MSKTIVQKQQLNMLRCNLFDLKNFEQVHICMNNEYVVLHNNRHKTPLLHTHTHTHTHPKDMSDVGGRLVVLNCIKDGKKYIEMTMAWVKAIRIISEFRILRLSFCRSQP